MVTETAHSGPTRALHGPGSGRSGGGCLKCGQFGHWARDCTATPEDIKRMKEANERTEGDGDANILPNTSSTAMPATGNGRRQRPKLTFDTLQDSKGIADLQANFYNSMKSVFRGKGHELSDTRRLLELYRRWSNRVMPVTGRTETFDSFIAGIENMSTKAVVKDMMNRKREDLLKRAREASILDVQGEIAGEDQELPGAGNDGDLEAAGDMMGGTSGKGTTAVFNVAREAGDAAADKGSGDDDDELLALVGIEDNDPDGLKDEELLALLDDD